MQAVGRARPLVALATNERTPGLAPDDQLLVPAFEAIGIDVECVVWSNDGAAWESFDAVVIRSCWDYHLRLAEFDRWLGRLESGGVTLFNSPGLVRWNSNKRYLIDLAARGVATIPTRLIPGRRGAQVEAVMLAEQWTRAVIKPAVSASGYETYAIEAPLAAADRARAERVTSLGDALLQPFADEVPRDGEFSFTFFDGSFSHATIKRASGDEFRVQTEHGGSVNPTDPPPHMVVQAGSILALLPEIPLYARVDGIQRGGQFLLMELELIEPNLFFEFQPGAANTFAAALRRRLRT